jgi:hypothetical protein
VHRKTFVFALVFLATSAVASRAQDAATATPVTLPVATRSQAACTGFIADPAISRDVFVLGGEDDDFHDVARQYVQGDSIFIAHRGEASFTVGTQFRVVRKADELFSTMHYAGQKWEIRKLGKPYQDIAEVTVTHVNPEGVVATINFSCEPVAPGDTLVAFQPRPVPEYALNPSLDHFAPVDAAKKQARIVASRNNYGYFGEQNVVYLNLGDGDGVKPGQRYRVYKVLPPHTTGFLTWEKTPNETVGEVVVISVQPKSCTALVVSSYREISAGDYIQPE